MRISFGTAVRDEVRSAVAPPPLCKTCRWCRPAWGFSLLPVLWPFPLFWRALWEEARCRHPTSLYRLPADYVTGRRQKPRRMSCNAARGNDRARCGPQARFWEARSYPAWVWRVAVVSAGLTIIMAYMAFLRWVFCLTRPKPPLRKSSHCVVVAAPLLSGRPGDRRRRRSAMGSRT